MRFRFLLAALLLTGLLPGCAYLSAWLSFGGDEVFVLRYGGTARTYEVHVPPSYSNAVPAAVVLAFHGGGGDAESVRLVSGLDEKADQEGFLAVYPQGTGARFFFREFGTWNAGGCCGPAMRKNVDDVGFVSALLDDLESRYNVAKRRIYATGVSNGAQMSYRLACDLSERIAAIAPVAGQGVFESCAPKRAVPILHFHGDADRCAKWKGGECGGCFMEAVNRMLGTGFAPDHFTCESVPAHIEKWRERLGLAPEERVTFQKGSTVCRTWGAAEPGENGAELVLCRSAGAGHTWPGGGYGKLCERESSRKCKIFKDIVGVTSQDLSATDVMWEFFLEHPMAE